MKPNLKAKSLTVDPNNVWKDDVLKRKEVAQTLTNIIEEETNPLVISLNGGWGTGKTFFLERWQQDLTAKGYQALYFNAWTDDFLGDPFIAIIGQLWAKIKEPDFCESVESLKQCAGSLLKKTFFNGLSTITGGIVNISEEELNSIAERAVSSYGEQTANREEFRLRLQALSKTVRDKTNHPLVFIIDELDRCRPTFAIELLERVKHIFETEDIVFVFGIDRKQLGESIRAVYGSIDVNAYLARFFDLDFSLQPPDTKAFCQTQLQRHEILEYLTVRDKEANSSIHSEESQLFIELFSQLSYRLGLTLRDCEHCIRHFILVLRNIPTRNRMFPETIALLILLRHKRHELYTTFVQRITPAVKLIDFLDDLFTKKTTDNSFYLSRLRSQLYGFDDDATNQLSKISQNHPVDRPDCLAKRDCKITPEEAKTVLTSQNNVFYVRHNSSAINYIMDKIEICAPLQRPPWDAN